MIGTKQTIPFPSGANLPASILINVVLPVPFSPNMTMISESVNCPPSIFSENEPFNKEWQYE